MITDLTPESILKQYYGYDSFRPMQKEVIEAVLQKNDVLVLMPTGGGKSVCYQIPAMLMPGLAIVVSPLISLMKDQVESLAGIGITAAYLNSSQTAVQQYAIEEQCRQGSIRLLYISPEKLLSQPFQLFLKTVPVNLFAIDEAHCISGWGHDFRPEYTQLFTLKEQFPDVPLMALTATADKFIRQDILDQLRLPEARVFVSSFNRPNLSIAVRPGRNKLTQIMDFLDRHPGEPGIIYCLSRSGCEELSDKLYKSGYRVASYHAGLPPADRASVQEAFLRDDLQIICATIAFGMGIDKSNVRWVMHYNLPKNMESYYQEIGRSGRDGLPAETILFYSFRDVLAWREILTKSTPDEKRLALQLSRLERMQQFAESHLCRRRILLNYFSEPLSDDCANCDVCRNPRTRFDGTVLAQKALSAVIRLKESVTAGTLIDVLRGSRSQTVLEKGYDRIKTYGAGADLKAEEWREYLQQMINTGVLEIAYHQRYVLQKGTISGRVLNGTQPVWLVKPEAEKLEQNAADLYSSPSDTLTRQLMERLKFVRKQLADAHNVPPYLVFSDKTLLEMARKRPDTDAEMRQIDGIGQRKQELYGNAFLQEIRRAIVSPAAENTRTTGGTYLQTYEAYRQGLSVETIAAQRELSVATVQSHLIRLCEKGYEINIRSFVSPMEETRIRTAITRLGPHVKARELYGFCAQQYDYFKIKLVLAVYRREESSI